MSNDQYTPDSYPSDELPPEGDPAAEVVEERPGCGWSLLLGLMGMAALLIFGFWAARQINRRNLVEPTVANYEGIKWLPDTAAPTAPDYELKIYFIAGGQFLSQQTRTSPGGSAQDAERLHQIARELANPPSTGLMQSPLVGNASVRGLYILNGIVYLDLSKEFLQPPAGASPVMERLAVYSFVNSFMLNMPSIKGVQFMIEGQIARSAWGWMDLSSPLGPDLSLVR